MRDPTDGREGAPGASTLEEPSNPYPGLAAFTETDAARFFGREAEVSARCDKIRRQTLHAVIGHSGVGKTSFLRAGVTARRPEGWASAYATPGPNPPLMLARALLPVLEGDTDDSRSCSPSILPAGRHASLSSSDVSKTPLHKRPLGDLLATLRSCTSLRVAPDPGSPGGYELVRDPFPGWAKVPEC